MHLAGQSTKLVADQMFMMLYRNKVEFFRKHYGVLKTQIYKLILYAASGIRLALSPLAVFSKPDRREEQQILVGNYRRLLSELGRM